MNLNRILQCDQRHSFSQTMNYIRAFVGRVTMVALLVVGVTGCALPDFAANVSYDARDAARQSVASATPVRVALRVVDRREQRGPARSNGDEIIARGDKGEIFVTGDYETVIRDGLRASLEARGVMVVDVAADAESANRADVVLDTEIRRVDVLAKQFTHHGLDSETGSTLDAVRVLIPRQPRNTLSRTILSATLRKHDRRMGYSYYTEQRTEEEAGDREVVGRVLSASLSQAAEDIAKQSFGDLKTVAALPVSDAELRSAAVRVNSKEAAIIALERELNGSRAELQAALTEVRMLRGNVATEAKDLRDEWARLEKEKEKPRRALITQADELASLTNRRLALEAQQAMLKASEAAMAETRIQLEAQKAADAAQREQFDAKLKKLADQAAEVADARAKIDEEHVALAAATEQAQAAKAAAAAEIEKLDGVRAELTGRQKSLADAAKNLERQASVIVLRDDTLRKEAAELAAQRDKLATWELSLLSWEQQLKDTEDKRDEDVRPDPALTKAIGPTITIQEPASTSEPTTIPTLVVRGSIMDDRQVVSRSFRVNGKAAPVHIEQEVYDGTRRARIRAAAPAEVTVVVRGITTEAAGTDPGATTTTEAGGARTFRQAVVHPVTEEFMFDAALKSGENIIEIRATDDDGLEAVETLRIELQPSDGSIHVIAIGINTYDQTRGVAPLRFARQDAEAFVDSIKVGLGVPGGNFKPLLDEAATRTAITQAFIDVRKSAKKDDTVVIFFSGHGVQDLNPTSPDGVDRYLMPVDGDRSNVSDRGLSMDDLSREFNKLNLTSDRVMLFLDTCYAGAATAGARGLPPIGGSTRAARIRAVGEDLQGAGRVIMTASQGDQVSHEMETLGHGVFTYYLLDAMRGAADANGDHRVTVAEAFNYVSREVARATADAQMPALTQQGDGDEIVLAITQ